MWRNTATLDKFLDNFSVTDDLESAQIAVLGVGSIDLEAMPALRAIFRCGVGTDNIPFDECQERGIQVGLPSYQSSQIIFDETADFTCFLILQSLFLPQFNLKDWEVFDRPLLSDRRALVIGNGNIGSRVAGKICNFIKVDSWDILDGDFDQLMHLLSVADVVSLHIPLDENTRGWFDRSLLEMMKDGACLVNTARGAIVNEGDLFQELDSGRLSARFDVFWEEPYSGPLSRLAAERFSMTPHMASHSINFVESLGNDFLNFVDKLKIS